MEITPDVERRVNEGFKAWMGSSLLSSDEEDEPDSYEEVTSHINHANFNNGHIVWYDFPSIQVMTGKFWFIGDPIVASHRNI